MAIMGYSIKKVSDGKLIEKIINLGFVFGGWIYIIGRCMYTFYILENQVESFIFFAVY